MDGIEKRKFGYTELLTEREYNVAIGVYLLVGMLLTGLVTYGAGDTAGILMEVHPLAFALIYLIVGYSSGVLCRVTKNGILASGMYFILCIMTGLLLSTYVPDVATDIVIRALAGTAGVLVIMVAAAVAYPKTFLSMGWTLFLSLISMIIVELVMMLMGMSGGLIDWIAVGIFSLYIGFDWAKGQEYDATLQGAVITSIELYLDLINIFVRLLSIMAKNKESD